MTKTFGQSVYVTAKVSYVRELSVLLSAYATKGKSILPWPVSCECYRPAGSWVGKMGKIFNTRRLDLSGGKVQVVGWNIIIYRQCNHVSSVYCIFV